MSQDVEPRKSGALKTMDHVALVVVAVVGIIIAFAVLHAIAGIIWFFVKAAIVVVIIGAVLWFLTGRRRR